MGFVEKSVLGCSGIGGADVEAAQHSRLETLPLARKEFRDLVRYLSELAKPQ